MFIENKYETESLKKCRGKGNNSVATIVKLCPPLVAILDFQSVQKVTTLG
jgi:hypothetical protein